MGTGRPRADAPGPSAQERIEFEFWAMLSEMPFPEMTIAELCARAKVNHNTFYRYSKSLPEYALRQISGKPAEALANEVVPSFCGAAVYDASNGLLSGQDTMKAASVAQNGSRPLVDAMCSKAIEIWMADRGIDAPSLGDGEVDLLASVFWGVTATLGKIPANQLEERALSFRTSDAGRGFGSVLTGLSKHSEGQS